MANNGKKIKLIYFKMMFLKFGRLNIFLSCKIDNINFHKNVISNLIPLIISIEIILQCRMIFHLMHRNINFSI